MDWRVWVWEAWDLLQITPSPHHCLHTSRFPHTSSSSLSWERSVDKFRGVYWSWERGTYLMKPRLEDPNTYVVGSE